MRLQSRLGRYDSPCGPDQRAGIHHLYMNATTSIGTPIVPTIMMESKAASVQANIRDLSPERTVDSTVPGRARWKTNILLGSFTASLVLAINVGVLGWVLSKFKLHNGIATIFDGSCSTAASISTWTHLAINIASSLLLAASNSAMQILVAPTRKEVDQAHARRRYLDIGVSTVRNLARVDKRRVFLWVLIGISSVPLHLLYNSVLFEISDANGFLVFTVGRDFVTQGPWNQTRADNCFHDYTTYSPAIRVIQGSIDGLVRLGNAECISAFGSGIQSSYGNVLAVSSQSTSEGLLNIISVEYGGGGLANNWVCDIAGRGTQYCDLPSMTSAASNWTLPGYSGPANLTKPYNFFGSYDCTIESPKINFPIDYCLAQPTKDHCQLGVSAVFLGIVILSNAFKVVCLFIMAVSFKHNPLVTIGDAIASFLDKPDQTTAGKCLLSRKNVHDWDSYKSLAWKPRRRNGFSAASAARWIICSILFVAMWCLCAGLLSSGITTLQGDAIPTSLAYLKNMGFGKPILNAVLQFSNTNLSFLAVDVLLANLPQLAVSLLYLLYNDLFTRMLLTKEWMSYGQGQYKPLRVTTPTGDQKSTYFLQLPIIYSVVLLVAMTLLHWLISQSLFVTLINLWDYTAGGATGQYKGLSTSGLGWSPYAIVFALTVGGIMILTLWIYALVPRASRAMPLAGSNSAAISAACHPLPWDINAARKPLRWGVVQRTESTMTGHASFTSGPVTEPIVGSIYA